MSYEHQQMIAGSIALPGLGLCLTLQKHHAQRMP